MTFLAIFQAALLAVAGTAGAQQPGRPTKAEDLYKTHCAACHGANWEGGLGGELGDGVWRHGATDADITRSIAKGNAEMGMAPWEGVLTPDQIRSLVILIREKERDTRNRTAPAPKPDFEKPFQTRHHTVRVEPFAEGLEIPWSLAFLPDGRMLVTERPGPVRIVGADGQVESKPVEGTPGVRHHGQGGMMEVAVHPGYATNGWIYLGFADPAAAGGPVDCMTAVVRGRIRDGRWTDQEWIFRARPEFYSGSGVHFGTRFVFDRGFLYFVVGERGGMMIVQDVKRPEGKIFRVHDDGRVPEDNPFAGQPGAERGIWSFGHRNPQGLAFDPRDGALYATEHGPRGGDEFNLIRKGANYGWPVITHGMNYNGTPMGEGAAKEGMEQPLVHWTPSIAACGLACYTGERFPRWKHDFFAGGLGSQELRRLRVEGGEAVEQETILKGIGRVRDVRSGPDGFLYLVLNGPDRIVRLVPGE